MRDLFIADAHLRDPSDANYRRLLAFLQSQRGQVRTLYLLGDIFDFWIGFETVVYACYIPFLNCLSELRSEGTEIVFCEGNHDFHLGKHLSQSLGCRILPDGATLTIDGMHVYITHGDQINTRDEAYRTWRRLLRSKPALLLTRVLHPDWIWRIYRLASRLSAAKHTPEHERVVPRQLLLDHASLHFDQGCQAVVTGHFHSPHIEHTPKGLILSLGDWINQYSFAVLEKGEFTLRTY